MIRSSEKFLSYYILYQDKDYNVLQIRLSVCIKMRRCKRRVCKRKALFGQFNISVKFPCLKSRSFKFCRNCWEDGEHSQVKRYTEGENKEITGYYKIRLSRCEGTAGAKPSQVKGKASQRVIL